MELAFAIRAATFVVILALDIGRGVENSQEGGWKLAISHSAC